MFFAVRGMSDKTYIESRKIAGKSGEKRERGISLQRKIEREGKKREHGESLLRK